MKILFVTNNYKPYSGGVVSSIDAFSLELRKQGHIVSIVTLDFEGAKETDEHVIRIVCPLKFFYKTNPIAVPIFVRWQLSGIIQSFKPDVVHAHHPFLLGSAAQKLCAKKTIPVVFTHHSQYGTYAKHYVPFFKKFARYCVEAKVKRFCKKITAIIAPSRSIMNDIQNQSIQTPLYCLPSGLLSCFVHKKQPLKKEKKQFYLLTVSRFVTEKNIPFLLRVMKKLDDNFVLILIGFGSHYEALQNYAFQRLKISEKQIQFIEKPSKKEIGLWYIKADLFIFASTTETQGLVCVESMAAGTPVVAVNGPGIDECVQDGINGYLVKTEKEMVKKILKIKDNKVLHKELCKGAWQTAQNYSIQVLTKKLVKVYESVI